MRALGLTFALLGVLALAAGCERGGRGPGFGRDSGMATGDGAAPDEDGGRSRDSGPARDSGGGADAAPPARDGGGGMVAPGSCDPACLAMPGAACCQTCGCGGAAVMCMPRCPEPYRWDCEIMCCFDYDTFECLEPSP